jgi:hypothetical protein
MEKTMAVPNGEFEEVWKILRNIAILQEQHEKILLMHSERLPEHHERLAAHATLMAEHDERLAAHATLMAQHDERMERVGRHLEALATICDDLIRNKADKKRHRTS